MLNDPDAGDNFGRYKVAAASPKGSLDIKSGVDRIAGYTEQMKLMGIEIAETDVVLIAGTINSKLKI